MIARLLLTAMLAQVPDAGALDAGLTVVPTVQALYATCPDAPVAEVVDGGYFVPEARQARLDCRQAICEHVANEALAKAPPATEFQPGPVIAITAGGTALAVVVFIVGFFVGKNVK